MDVVRHEPSLGRRLHEESIRLQQSLADVPLPREKTRTHLLLRVVGGLLTAVVLIGLALVLLPAGPG